MGLVLFALQVTKDGQIVPTLARCAESFADVQRAKSGKFPHLAKGRQIVQTLCKRYEQCAYPSGKGLVKRHPPVNLADRSMGPMDSQNATPLARGQHCLGHQVKGVANSDTPTKVS